MMTWQITSSYTLGPCYTAYCMPQSTYTATIIFFFFFFLDEDWAKEKQKLYDAIGYQEDGPGTVYRKEVYVTPFSGSFCKDFPPCIAYA